MIVVQVNGGLGNQLFQYSFGRYLAFKHNTKLLLDFTLLKYYPKGSANTRRLPQLDIFNIRAEAMDTENPIIQALLGKKLFYKVYNKYYLFSNGLSSLIEDNSSYDELINSKDNVYIVGHFQSELFFQHIRNTLLYELTFKNKPTIKNLKLIKEIESCNSVSIHIRRGDYLKSNNLSKHGLLSLSYYYKAIDYIKRKIEKPFFYVFSDDINWVKQNLQFDSPKNYIEHNIGKDAPEDLRLMSKCKHNIVANSSFSWWGAWLNVNEGKIVIAPERWYTDPNAKINQNITPESWIRILN